MVPGERLELPVARMRVAFTARCRCRWTNPAWWGRRDLNSQKTCHLKAAHMPFCYIPVVRDLGFEPSEDAGFGAAACTDSANRAWWGR